MTNYAVTVERPPRGLYRLQGALVRRRVGFTHPARLTCHFGHRVREETLFREDGGLRCGARHLDHRGASFTGRHADRAAYCEAMVYVLIIRPDFGDRWLFAADCTASELAFWEQSHYRVEDVFEWLGADLPSIARNP